MVFGGFLFGCLVVLSCFSMALTLFSNIFLPNRSSLGKPLG